MKRAQVVIILLILVATVTNCGSNFSSKSTPIPGSPDVKPKPEDAQIDVFQSEKEVARPYVKLCRLVGRTYDPLTTGVVEPALKPEAWKCGADAIIIQNHMGHMNRDEVVMLGITAIAIRYQDNKQLTDAYFPARVPTS